MIQLRVRWDTSWWLVESLPLRGEATPPKKQMMSPQGRSFTTEDKHPKERVSCRKALSHRMQGRKVATALMGLYWFRLQSKFVLGVIQWPQSGIQRHQTECRIGHSRRSCGCRCGVRSPRGFNSRRRLTSMADQGRANPIWSKPQGRADISADVIPWRVRQVPVPRTG